MTHVHFKKDYTNFTAPLDYNLYQGKFENCKKDPCREEAVLTKEKYVDVESELLNIDRPINVVFKIFSRC